MNRINEFSGAIVSGSSGAVNESAAKAVLKDVWRHGHETVELRRDGKRVIFFCSLCSTRCYSDGALLDHLNGNLHTKRYAAAKMSILANPAWPFNDGVVFSFPSSKSSSAFSQQIITSNNNNCQNYCAFSQQIVSSNNSNDNSMTSENGSVSQLKGEVCLSRATLEWIGCGHAYMRVLQVGAGILLPSIKAIWCCWLGDKSEIECKSKVAPECDYGIVTFPYSQNLGRGGISSSVMEVDKGPGKKKRRGRPPKINLHPLFQVIEDDIPIESISEEQASGMSNRALKRALRRQKLRALDRLCFICHHQMLPGKDVAALYNRKSGLMTCSSRNRRGAFHVFHTSCLIDWVLLCESKIWLSRSKGNKVSRKNRWTDQRSKANGGKQVNGPKSINTSCETVFCPECQGTGLKTRAGQLEIPRYRLAQVFNWIMELIISRKSWMDHPEQLQECATGLLFSPSDNEGDILSLLLLHFYAAKGSENSCDFAQSSTT